MRPGSREEGSESAGVRLYVPSVRTGRSPTPTPWTPLFVVTGDATTRGVSLEPTGETLFGEFQAALGGPSPATPAELVGQVREALVEQFEIAGAPPDRPRPRRLSPHAGRDRRRLRVTSPASTIRSSRPSPSLWRAGWTGRSRSNSTSRTVTRSRRSGGRATIQRILATSRQTATRPNRNVPRQRRYVSSPDSPPSGANSALSADWAIVSAASSSASGSPPGGSRRRGQPPRRRPGRRRRVPRRCSARAGG